MVLFYFFMYCIRPLQSKVVIMRSCRRTWRRVSHPTSLSPINCYPVFQKILNSTFRPSFPSLNPSTILLAPFLNFLPPLILFPCPKSVVMSASQDMYTHVIGLHHIVQRQSQVWDGSIQTFPSGSPMTGDNFQLLTQLRGLLLFVKYNPVAMVSQQASL